METSSRWLHPKWGKIVVALATVLIVGFFLYRVRSVLTPFLIAIVIAYLLQPLVDWLERRDLSRGLSILGTYLVLFGIITVFALFVVPGLIGETTRLVTNMPQYARDIEGAIEDFEIFYIETPLPQAVRDTVNQTIASALATVEDRSAELLSLTFSGVMGVLSNLFSVLLGLVLAIYFLKDAKSFRGAFTQMFPQSWRSYVGDLLESMSSVLEGFFHGRLIVSALVGVGTAIILAILGVRFVLLLAFFAAVTNLIPFFGPFIGAIPALILAGLDSWALFVKVGITYIVIQQLDGLVLTPRILGDRTGLHPLAVVLAVLAGGAWFGLWGLFLGVPVVAALNVGVAHLLRWINAEGT